MGCCTDIYEAGYNDVMNNQEYGSTAIIIDSISYYQSYNFNSNP